MLKVISVLCFMLAIVANVLAQDRDDIDTEIFPPDCKDKAGWCGEMPARDCYVNNDTCCQRCTLLRTTDETCPYGDHTGWCSSIHPGLCYRDHEKSTCCFTCKNMNTGPKGCEYGDRVSWCEEEEGVCDTMTKILCCKTCKGKGTFNLNTIVQKWRARISKKNDN